MYQLNNERASFKQVLTVLAMLCSNYLFAAAKIHSTQPPDTGHSVFIKIAASKNKVYAGEPFTVQYILYSTYKINDPQDVIDVKLRDCDQESYPEIENTGNQLKNAGYYRVVLLKKLLVIPQPQLRGGLQIPGIGINLNVILPPKKDDFLETEQTVVKRILSDTRSIEVLQLPSKKDSILFSGAVGQFKITCQYIPSVKNPNIITVRLSVNGTGNLRYVNWPVPVIPPGVDIYNMAHHEIHELVENNLGVSHVFSFDLSSNYRGVFNLNPIAFSYFDPETAKYVNYESTTYQWKTGKGQQLPATLAAVNTNVQNANNLLLSIKSKLGIIWFYHALFNPAVYYLTIFLSILFISAGLCYTRYRKIWELNLAARNFIKAEKSAYKSIRKLSINPERLDQDHFYKSINQILEQYACHKNYLPYVPCNLKTGIDLFPRELPAEIRDQIMEFLLNQNTTRFSPNKQDRQSREQVCLNLKQIIENLEHTFND